MSNSQKEPSRKSLHVTVSTPVADAYAEFCALEGVSLTGLVEALGNNLESLGISDEIITEARLVDADRRRRKAA